ncbi:MAG: hypothetical protein SCK29_08775 [Bacillota bacterium]|nr:hypothetical protein [Bacillota bacterium]MDW7684192.1 hypothetical protein [Bacillota bacterium]
MSKKWLLLLLVLALVAVLTIGCGGDTNTPDEPTVVEGSTIPHAVDGEYEDCMNCHGTAISESHADFDSFADRCLDCHAQE